MTLDPFHYIQEECFISTSQEVLLANIPGWKHEKPYQGLLTPIHPLSDDAPVARRSRSRSTSSGDVRSSDEGISGIFPGQRPVIWMSPSDGEDEKSQVHTSEDENSENNFESERSESPRAVSSVIRSGASCRELRFMEMSDQPFTQPQQLTPNTSHLPTDLHHCDDDDQNSSHSKRSLRFQSNANRNKSSESLTDYRVDTSAMKAGSDSSPKACVSLPKISSNQLLERIHEQSKKEQRLLLSRVICSPQKVTTKELLAAVEELLEEEGESQEACEARLFSASALLSTFIKPAREEAAQSHASKHQSLQQISVRNLCELGKTERTELKKNPRNDQYVKKQPRNDQYVQNESCFALREQEAAVADVRVKSNVTFSPRVENAQDHTINLSKENTENLEQVHAGVAKRACETAKCEKAHKFPRTVLDVEWSSSDSEEECATGYDFLKIFLNSGLPLPLSLHQ